VSATGHMPQTDSVVDLQKLQELEQRVGAADQPLNKHTLQHKQLVRMRCCCKSGQLSRHAA
jgi:hypothetical protein